MVQLVLPLFGVQGAFSLGGIAITTATGGLTLAGNLINLGIGLALNQALAPDIPGLGPQNINLNGAEATAPRIRHYGHRRVGYARVLFDVKDGTLGRVIVHGHGEWASIDEYYIDRELVALDVDGFVTTDKFVSGATNYVRIVSRLGKVPSTYFSELEETFSYWDETHRLDGLTCSALKVIAPPASQIGNIFPNREPVLEVVGRSSKLLDPRTGETAYSPNAALVVRDFLSHPDGFDRAFAVDDTYFKAAANVCDEQIPLAEGGTAARYEYHGSYTLNEPRLDVLKRLLQTCAGDVFFLPSGKIGVEVGAWYEPEFTLTEDMVISHEYSTGVDPINGYNSLYVKYEDPDQNFAVVDAQVWEDTQRLEAEGEEPSEISIGGHTHMQARAVAKIMMDRANPKSRLKVSCKPMAVEGFFEARMRVYMPNYGIDGVYRVERRAMDSLTHGIDYELSEIRQDAYTLTLAEQGQKPVLPVTEDGGGVPSVAGFVAAPQGVQTAQNAFIAGIGAAWNAPTNASLTPLLEYSVAGADNWQAASLSDGATAAQITGLTDGGSYDVRIAWITSGGAVGPYVVEEGVTATADTTAPAAPTGFTVTDETGGNAQVSLTTSASAGLWKTEVRRDATLIATLFDGPGQAVVFFDSPGAGTYDYTARSINVSGVQNTTDAGPVTVTIT